ncbi:hypothetical protein BC826DRAFT_1114014 [Russula brevipes]|nr:hypothetical protein BC826DRAFT_1114014 [Russula brevipes]
MAREVLRSQAEAKASAAHCTIMMRAASAAREELESLKRKSRRSVKTAARYVTHPALREQWAATQEEKARKEREAAQKEAQKTVDEATRKLQIQEAIKTRIFTDSLSSYKLKDDLIILAGALGLNTTGTVNDLNTQIRSHLSAHPELQRDARFSGLFSSNRRRRVDNEHVESLQ